MDDVVESTDFSRFDGILLGGDLASFTSADDATMDHIDGFFDLGANSTLWALGNHDYSDTSRVRSYTGRKPYYTWFDHGTTFVALDTQQDSSRISGAQLDFFNSVIDTMSLSHTLVVMTHKLIWMSGNEELELQIDDVSNGPFGTCGFCLNPNNFYTDVAPRLIEMKLLGIEVICLAGDVGNKIKQFEYTDASDIHYLACGMKAGDADNMVIRLFNWPELRAFHWKFVPLGDL